MIRTNTRPFRALAYTLALTVLNLTVPLGFASVVGPIVDEAFKAGPPKPKAPQSHLLSVKTMNKMQGKTGQNPYVAGQNKWDLTYQGLDLLTGNFSTSVTDIDFNAPYGIGVNVTRSYSSNSLDDGPFGMGWSLSADVRNTAGGILKSKGAPIRSVPVHFKERSSQSLDDPNFVGPTGSTTQPVTAVEAVDASGKTETLQKDVDGILSTPPWDNNTVNSQYTQVTLGRATYQVLVSNQVITLDGTTYNYAAEGSYPTGTYPWDNINTALEAANVLKITSVTDRQNQTTYYSYGSGTVTFVKSDGTTVEHPLIGVAMPNGQTLTFTWGTTANGTANRIASVTDGTRTVLYGYTNYNGAMMLSSVTSPAGMLTQYGYNSSETGQYSAGTAYNLLTSITDPRSLTTWMTYQVLYVQIWPYGAWMPAAVCQRITQPNGVEFYYGSNGGWYGLPDGDWPSDLNANNPKSGFNASWEAYAGSAAGSGTYIWSGAALVSTSSGSLTVTDWNGALPQAIGYGYPVGTTNVYQASSENLIETTTAIAPYAVGSNAASGSSTIDLSLSRNLQYGPTRAAFNGRMTDEQTTYNFAGNPLSKIDTETQILNQVQTVYRQATTSMP